MTTQFLRQKEAPFLLALLLGVTAWIVTHTVDRLQSRPIVEYRLREIQTTNGTEVRCRIENLCTDRCFRNLRFALVKTNDTGFFTNSTIQHMPPGTHSEDFHKSDKEVAIVFVEFHPRWAFELRTEKVGEFPYDLRVRTHSKVPFLSDVSGGAKLEENRRFENPVPAVRKSGVDERVHGSS